MMYIRYSNGSNFVTITPSYVWWDVKPAGVLINIGDQLFSVTIPSIEGDTLRDRQVKYFEITWEQRSRSAGFIILRNGVMVHDDGPGVDGYGNVIFTKRYSLPLPDILPPEVVLPPVVLFDLQTWEAAQTDIPKDGSYYQVVSQNYPDYADGLTWTFVPVDRGIIPMVENVAFPPAGESFKLEIIWKDKGLADGSQSAGFTFQSSGVLGFVFQKSGIKVQMIMRKTDGSTFLFKPLSNTIVNDTPIDLTYKEVFTYNAGTREYLFEHFEGVDLTTVNASATGFFPIEDGDWGYGPTNEYFLNNNGNQEYLKITVTTPSI